MDNVDQLIANYTTEFTYDGIDIVVTQPPVKELGNLKVIASATDADGNRIVFSNPLYFFNPGIKVKTGETETLTDPIMGDYESPIWEDDPGAAFIELVGSTIKCLNK